MAKHTFTTVAIASLMALGACASPAEIAQREWATCQGYGFQPGSQAMSQCLMTVDQQRQNRDALDAAVWNAHVYSMGSPALPGAAQSEALGQMWAWPNWVR
jgi:hypothetical protein